MRDVKDVQALVHSDTAETLSMQLSQIVVLQVQLPHCEMFKHFWRQRLQLVSGYLQDMIALMQLDTSETLGMQLSQLVVLQVELLDTETFEDSS